MLARLRQLQLSKRNRAIVGVLATAALLLPGWLLLSSSEQAAEGREARKLQELKTLEPLPMPASLDEASLPPDAGPKPFVEPTPAVAADESAAGGGEALADEEVPLPPEAVVPKWTAPTATVLLEVAVTPSEDGLSTKPRDDTVSLW